MKNLKIGIIREGKVPTDKRVPLSPVQARQVKEQYPQVHLVVQHSPIRCYTDAEYASEGIEVVPNVSDCDVIFGVKEIPLEMLPAGKTCFFFSHTIKKQPYNRKLLQAVLAKKIRLVDYETLTDSSGRRIIAFGRWAGIVGAYNGIWTYGQRFNLFHLRRAHECFDLEDLKTEFAKVKLPPVKIALTGGGRVAKGALEVLLGMGIRKVTPAAFLTERFQEPVFTQLNSRDYNRRTDGADFSRDEFFKYPERYESAFGPFACQADILLAAAYWDPRAPALFSRKEMTRPEFAIQVIADITCDIEGSIPSTKKASTIADPVYDFNPEDDRIEAAFSDEGNISVMAIDNLPCELPRDASTNFGEQLLQNVLPCLLGTDPNDVIGRATIAENGQLTKKFDYLTDYVSAT